MQTNGFLALLAKSVRGPPPESPHAADRAAALQSIAARLLRLVHLVLLIPGVEARLGARHIYIYIYIYI